MQDHIGDAQHMWQRLLFDASNSRLQHHFIFLRFHELPLVIDGACEESAGSAGRIEYNLVQLGRQPVDNELGDCARSVELTRVARALQVFQYLFINRAEGVAISGAVEVDLVDLVNHLPHQRAGFHVVIGILEHIADNLCSFAHLADGGELGLESGEQFFHELD